MHLSKPIACTTQRVNSNENDGLWWIKKNKAVKSTYLLCSLCHIPTVLQTMPSMWHSVSICQMNN